jgi:NADPH:quinone reductase-like Zn-dependent oxidoreductase
MQRVREIPAWSLRLGGTRRHTNAQSRRLITRRSRVQIPPGKIRPVVAERLPLVEARRAHEPLESSASKGKLVLVP